MKIAIVNLAQHKYGGNIYENMVEEALSKKFEVEFISLVNEKRVKNSKKRRSILKYFEVPLILWNLYKISRRKDFDIVIRTFDASYSFISKKPTKNISLIHHIDNSGRPLFLRFIYSLLEKLLFQNLWRFDGIVCVSEYWKKYFENKGYKNVYKIYNGFDLKKFNITEEEAEEFKIKYNLTRKPIIYIGNCQKGKGVVEVYNILKTLEVHLVTSGYPYVKIPAINLNYLSYRDYLKLLKSSSVVVLMSKFKEGWNRSAHEAMLCKTPVIGSGLGGMKELLEGGGQIVCDDFSQLKGKVEYLLNNEEIRKKIGEDGFRFGIKFSEEKFIQDWLNFIEDIS